MCRGHGKVMLMARLSPFNLFTESLNSFINSSSFTSTTSDTSKFPPSFPITTFPSSPCRLKLLRSLPQDKLWIWYLISCHVLDALSWLKLFSNQIANLAQIVCSSLPSCNSFAFFILDGCISEKLQKIFCHWKQTVTKNWILCFTLSAWSLQAQPESHFPLTSLHFHFELCIYADGKANESNLLLSLPHRNWVW